ncbi:unnamed protein product [Pedinophyceae sp. YPF-701]|nr:unnamed protein product [Pedinophyceae sp. YPF-701]
MAKLNTHTPESEWQKVLSKEEYYVLRQKGTERPGTGKFNKHSEPGTYNCKGCGTALYTSEMKFDSGCGWPAFWDEIPGAIDRHPCPGKKHVEITCKNCGGHLGHVFSKRQLHGAPQPKERHCVNSVSLDFVPKE